MKILHFIPHFPYFGGTTLVGGHANSLYHLARAQSAAGDSVTIVSAVVGQRGEVAIGQGVTLLSLTPAESSGTAGSALRFLVRAALWLARNGKPYDVVHVHSGFVDYVLLAAFVSTVLRKPTVHTLYCPVSAHHGRWANRLYRSVLVNSLLAMDALTCMSQNIAVSLAAFSPRSRPQVVHCAVDHERYAPGNGQAYRKKLGLREDDVAILFVGNAKPQKNLTTLLSAFHRLRSTVPQARLIVTTELKHSATDVQMEQLRIQVEELGLEDRVIQLGIVDDMPSLMRACDMVVAPFLDTQGPSDYFLAALEAMATAKPVVVSAVGGMPEVIDDSTGRLIDPTSIDSLVSAMQELAEAPELRQQLGVQSRQVIRTQFDPEVVRDQMDDIYRRLVSQCQM